MLRADLKKLLDIKKDNFDLNYRGFGTN